MLKRFVEKGMGFAEYLGYLVIKSHEANQAKSYL